MTYISVQASPGTIGVLGGWSEYSDALKGW